MEIITVRDLIERLEGCDPDAEVMLATQPGWPLQHRLMGVAEWRDIAAETACEEHDAYGCDECAGEAGDAASVVYLVEGDQPDYPYAPRGAWEAAR